jgi:hypothetical protein
MIEKSMNYAQLDLIQINAKSSRPLRGVDAAVRDERVMTFKRAQRAFA